MKKLPRTTVTLDESGAIAHRLGMRTSGHVIAYDRRGVLVYSGGITASRGHAGENEGARQLRVSLEEAIGERSGEAGGLVGRPVFGCELVMPGGAECEVPE